MVLAGFLAGYSGLTRQAYELDLRQFASWCQQHQLRLFQARRADIELFARDLETRGRARATITRRPCTVAGFYRYAVEEELLEHSPAAHVRRSRLESAWSNGKPAYRCRHGYTSATSPDPTRPKNLYIREDKILPRLADLAILRGRQPASEQQAKPRGDHPARPGRGPDRPPARHRRQPHLRPRQPRPADRHQRCHPRQRRLTTRRHGQNRKEESPAGQHPPRPRPRPGDDFARRKQLLMGY